MTSQNRERGVLGFARHSLRIFDAAIGLDGAALNWKGRAIERAIRILWTPRATARRVRAWWFPQSPANPFANPFIGAFLAKYSRAPRILHIGNIANNAYLNAKLLNETGYDCDVICYDYYHAMGSPEWEQAEFPVDTVDPMRPDWSSVDLGGYVRPMWFAQGPQQLCIDYLIARRRGTTERAQRLWEKLAVANKTRLGHGPRRVRALAASQCRFVWEALRHRDTPHQVWARLERLADTYGVPGWLMASVLAPFSMLLLAPFQIWNRRRPSGPRLRERDAVRRTLADINRRFASVFRDRQDHLTAADWAPYTSVLDRWAELMSHYDIVQAYSTDVAYPLLTGYRPYLGFEHGTLRTFTMGDTPICRLTALGYREADHVLITNGDCLEYAEKIGVRSYTPMLHPIDDARIRQIAGASDELHRRYGARYLFLCPLRHDWVIKGTDVYIRAMPGIAARIGRDFRVIMTRWGAQLDDSRDLARTLGVDDLIVWIDPLNRSGLIRLQKSVDIVFDQIALPHFGATAPQAIAAGVPVIMSYEPASTEWIIPEPAPVLRAWTPEEVVTAVVTALDPEWRRVHIAAASQWFEAHHSGAEAVRRLSRAYDSVCRATGIL